MRSPSAFWYELRRRNVVRAAVLYVGAVWALAQGIAQLSPAFGMPDTVTRWFVLACAIGFPFWLALTWLYELTPEGLRRDRRTATEQPPQPRRNRRQLDYAIIAVLSVAVVLLATNTLVDRTRTQPAAKAGARAAQLAALPKKSLAVLPFSNAGRDPSEQYFSDGIAEDLITSLSQFAGLKVISRNSAFQFRDNQGSPAEIGLELGVAHLLEGSVKRDRDEVRIRVELIRVIDGSTVWSERYTRPWGGLFRLQDEITAAVTRALEAPLMETGGAVPQTDRPANNSLDAYSAYLRGNAYYAGNNEADLRRALDAYTEAVRTDPHYAAAYAQISMVWTNLANQFLNAEAAPAAFAHARAAANIALSLDPRLAMAHAARGLLLDSADFDWYGARDEYARALQLSPHDPKAQFYLASLVATLGEPARAVELARQSLSRDPRNVSRRDWLAGFLIGLGRLDEAQREIEHAIALRPDASGLHAQLAVIATLRGDAAQARAEAGRETPGAWRDSALAMALQIGPDQTAADQALEALIRTNADTMAYQIAQVYALRSEPAQAFAWLDRAWNNRDSGIVYLLYDPFLLRYKGDPRFAAFCRRVGLPTPAAIVDAGAHPPRVPGAH